MYNANYFTEKYLYNTYLCENQPENFYEMHESRQKVKGKRAYLNPFSGKGGFFAFRTSWYMHHASFGRLRLFFTFAILNKYRTQQAKP